MFVADCATFAGRNQTASVARVPAVGGATSRQKRARLRRVRSRSRQSACALGDIRHELRRLERVGLLLQELVVESRILRLLGLLLQGARTELRLRPLKRRRLRARTEARQGLGRARTHAVNTLAERGQLRAGAGALGVSLLPNTGELPGRLLQGGAVGLLRRQVDALLLLRRRQGLSVAGVEQVGVDISVSQLLLLREVSGGYAATVATKSPRLDSTTKLTRHGLLVILIQERSLGADHRPQVGAHELADLLTANLLGVDGTGSSQGEIGGGLVVGLRTLIRALRGGCGGAVIVLSRALGPHKLLGRRAVIRLRLTGSLVSSRNARLLLLVYRGDKLTAVLLERGLGYLLRIGVNSIVLRQYIRRDRNLLRRLRSFAPHI